MDWSLSWRLALIALLGLFGAAQYFTDALPEPASPPENGFSFAALGDAPYGVLDELQYKFVLEHIGDHELDFVLHVGDILGADCSDANYQNRLDWFNSLPQPVMYTPGDNEWTDCYGYNPYERLKRIREIFYPEPNRSLGTKPMRLTTQAKYYNSSASVEANYVENQFWTVGEIGFATFHLVGSANGINLGNPAEAKERIQMAIQWMDDVFRIATSHDGDALVLAFHANPGFDAYHDDKHRQVYQPFVDALIMHAIAFDKPILVIQGNDHEFIVNQPLTDSVTGKALANVTRLQVPGSPHVGWVKVDVLTAANNYVEFNFYQYVVPNWKYF